MRHKPYTQKLSDEKFLELYKRKDLNSDKKMANEVGVHNTIIFKRRQRFGLVAKGRGGKEKLNSNELKQRWENEKLRMRRNLEKNKNRHKFNKDWKIRYPEREKEHYTESNFKKKLSNLPEEVIDGMISAIDDFRNGRYTILTNQKGVELK